MQVTLPPVASSRPTGPPKPFRWNCCRIVADFKKLNRYIQRPVLPTESANQLLGHRDPKAKFFATMDLTSGYHQIPLDEESQNLLVISTPMGRFKYLVLAQGVCSASDIFNFLTDGMMRYDGSESIKKYG